jgi:tetratricopeptide (TPR) repeat protein
MAKKITIKKPGASSSGHTAAYRLPELHGNGWLFLKKFWFQAIAIAIIGVVFYGSTVSIEALGIKKNQYALDDDIIMKQNMYVQKGFSGIGEILTNDAYKSYYESMGVEQQLSGGRYRPLSIVTFAIEQQLFGDCYGKRYTEVRDSLFDLQRRGVNDVTSNRLTLEKNELDRKIKKTNEDIAGVRHGFQVFWFVIALLVLLWLFREHIFRSNTDIAFLTVLLFAIHPIHTEVIANVKSRDEIFSILFIGLTFIFFFRYDLKKRGKDVAWGMVCFFLAFLSKEYAAMMVFLIPLSLMIFHKRKFKDLVYLVFPIAGVVLVYLIFRLGSIGGTAAAPVDVSKQDPLNDPYLYAKPQQEALSKINRLDDYLYLLFFPWPLVSDYSYQHFPYSDISDPMVWLSVFVNIGLVVLLFRLWKTRHPLSFALLLYFGFFVLVSNMLFDIGATMGERLIFHSSLGFCMAIAWLLVKGVEKVTAGSAATVRDDGEEKRSMVQPAILTLVFILLSIPAFIATQKRNADWRNDFTLFTQDVKTHPNSALTNGNAGARYMDKGLFYLGRDTIIGTDTILKYGRDTVKVHLYADSALGYLIKATTLHKKYVNGYLNLGLCYYYTDRYGQAAEAWGNAWRYFPSNTILLSYEQMFLGQANNRAARKDYKGAAEFFGYAVTAVPSDAKAWADYAGASFMAQDFTTAKMAFNEASMRDTTMRAALQNGYNAAAQNEAAMNEWKQDSMNVQSNIKLANYFMGTEQFRPTSKRLLNKALVLDPGNPRAVKLLDSLGGLEEQQRIKEQGLKK